MASDLDSVFLGADVVSVVDHPVGEPERPLFDGLQMIHRRGSFDANLVRGGVSTLAARISGYLQPTAAIDWRISLTTKAESMDITTMDEFDLRILRAVLDDGRVSVQRLSEVVGLSATPVARRLNRLEANGVITGYSALVDEARLGFGVTVFVSVKLDRQVDDALEEFERAVDAMPEVVDCWLMTGNRDYLLRVVTRDMGDFERFLTGRLTRLGPVAEIESSIPLRRVKAGTARTP